MSEKQLTFTQRHHQLTNINVWTADSQWLAFDVRPSGASFTSLTIERVNVHSGAVEVLYQARDGAHVGVVTVSRICRRAMSVFMGQSIPMRTGTMTFITGAA